jgi:dihydroneopterin aldolase
VNTELSEMHDHYIEAVNSAVADGRYDLVEELADAYADEALRQLTSEAR